MNFIKKFLKKTFNSFGYQITKIRTSPKDPFFNFSSGKISKVCQSHTMTSPESMYSLYEAVKYTIKNHISGDFVECGVWRGGSAMIIAYALLEVGAKDRKIYLYDTFEGMSKPTEQDYSISENTKAIEKWRKNQRQGYNEWGFASLQEVEQNLLSTGFPKENLIFVKGRVEDTIFENKPEEIALLRLDTDWYESTKHELINLFPLLSKRGVLIIDDYGAWAGAKKAVDEYFTDKPILLSRIDNVARLAIKT